MRQPEDDKWTIDGVSPDAQRMAREAARREHLKLGAWLDRVIRDAAVSGIPETDAPKPENPRPHRRYF